MEIPDSSHKPRTWQPVTAGILSIINGAFELLGGIIVSLVAAAISALVDGRTRAEVAGIPFMIIGIAAIAGGFFSLKKRFWTTSLAGAICALVVPLIFFAALWATAPAWALGLGSAFIICGILSLIFIVQSRHEFN